MELFKLFGIIALQNEAANAAIDETTGKAEGSGSKISNAFKKIGTAVTTYFAVEKIISFGKEIVNVAANVSAEVSAFEQIMGDYSDEASEKVEQIADAVGIVDSRLTPYMTSITAKFSGLGYGIEESTDLATRGLTLAADAAAFWDKSLEESISHLNSFINGSYEGGEAIGLFANDTQMATFAIEQGIVKNTKAWSSLDEATKQATRLKYAENMFKMSGATGQAAKESKQYANVQANLTEKWRQFKAEIGEPLLQHVVIPAIEILSEVVDFASEKIEDFKEQWPELSDKLQDAGGYIEETFSPALETFREMWDRLTKALQPVIDKVKEYISSGKAATDGTNLLQGAIVMLSTIFQAICTIIIYVIDVIGWLVNAWRNADDVVREFAANVSSKFQEIKNNISNAVSNAKDFVSNAFTNIKNSISTALSNAYSTTVNMFSNIRNVISEKINSAKSAVQDAVNKIKGFFNFEWKLPHIKLPHFSISGKFSLSPLSVPKISVAWYKKAMDEAMLLNQPTIFGMNGAGQLLGGGEAGQEVVAGSKTLMSMIQEAVAVQNAGVVDTLEKILSAIVTMDDNMGGNMREALDGTSLSINNREFARMVRGVV